VKPRLLDLFCGAGGSAVGYHRAGFDVVGVDNQPQPRYPFEFHQADALHVLNGWRVGFQEPYALSISAIHASPPCQAYSVTTRDKTGHPDLVAEVRELLERTGLPYVIENVPGAPLREPVTICGSSLGLRVRRHRLFETNWLLMVPPCAHGQQGQPVGVYGEGSATGQKRGRKASTEAEVLAVMEMPWADRKTATQAIPPVYTELVGHQLMACVKARAT
jgi:DNA (cytosine-5)-methyltransferase 1